MNPLPPRILCENLVEIGLVILENKIFKVCQHILTISQLFHLGKGHVPSFKQTLFQVTPGCFVPSLIEIVPVVLKIFKVRQCIFIISLLSPLGKGRGPSFEQI